MNELSLFTNAFHHAAIGMALVGTDGHWIKVNRSLCHIVGYSKEELLNTTFQSITYPEDLDVNLNYFRQMLNGEIEYYQMEKRYFHKKGNVVWVLLSVSCVCDQEKRPLYFISQIQDITARKEAEEIQKRLNVILEATTDFVATADTNGRVLYYNASARKMLGIDETQDISTITIPDTHPEWAGKLILNEALPTATLKGVWNGETVLLSLDGREIPVSQVIIAHKTSDGKVAYFSTIARDITDRKIAEEKKRLSSTVMEHIPEGVVITDAVGNTLSVNPAFTKITGYKGEEVDGKNLQKYFFDRCDIDFFEKMREILIEKEKWLGEVWIRHKNETAFLLDMSIITVTDEKREVLHYVYLFKDITEEKRREEKMKKSDRLSVVGQLAAGIAHEIRNPLTVLKGFIQIQSKNHENAEHSELMLSELDRINLFISELLVLAKPQVIRYEKKDLRTLLQNIITFLEPQAILNNVQISFEFLSDIPPIECEENKIKQVFINVLKNAIEAMPNGGDILVQLKKQGQDHVLIRVIDQGCGIQEERLSKLGEPFYSTKEKGTGLGLMISYKIIKDHQGSIQVSSEKNKGTAVDVILPISLDRSEKGYE